MVVDVSDAVELNRMMAEYPLIPYFKMDVRPKINAGRRVTPVVAGDVEDAI
jgi:muconolactone delta-isomerase